MSTAPLPSYAAALAVPTVEEVEADLLSRFPGAPSAAAIAAALAAGQPIPTGSSLLLQGWSADAPQRQLLTAEATALQFQLLQIAILAYVASPSQIRQLRAFLVSQGYSAADAAGITSAWVDVALEWYGTPRLLATSATWSILLNTPAPQTVDAQSAIVLQASDGTFFVSAQVGTVAFASNGSKYAALVTFAARAAGTTGNVVAGSIAYVNQGPAGLAVKSGDPTTQILITPARDTESDESALDRAQGRWGTRGNELTASGWRYIMQTPSAGGVATLTTVLVDDANAGGPGVVTIAVGNVTGLPTVAELTQAQAQGAAYTLAGGPAPVVVAVAVLTVAISAVLKTDGSNPLAAAQGASALAQLGGKVTDALYLSAVIAALQDVAGVVSVVSLSLSADVPRPPGASIVVSPTVTAT